MEDKKSETMNVWVNMPDGKREISKDVIMAIVVRSVNDKQGVRSEVKMCRVGSDNVDADLATDSLMQRHFAAHIALSEWISRNIHGGDLFMTKAEEIRCSGALTGHVKTLNRPPTEEDWEALGREAEDEDDE